MRVPLISKGNEAIGISAIVAVDRAEIAQRIIEDWKYKGDVFFEAVEDLVKAIHNNKFETTLEPELLNIKDIASKLEEVETLIEEVNRGK